MTVAPDQKGVDAEVRLLSLILSDFTLIDVFDGFYPLGWRFHEAEPSHKFIVKAKWKYQWNSDKLGVNDGEITPEFVEIHSAENKEHSNLSQARNEYMVVHIPTTLFEPLVRAVQRGDIETAQLRMGAELHGTHNWYQLIFGHLQITHNENQHTLGDIAKEFKEILRHVQFTLYFIVALLLFVLWRLSK